MNIFNAKFNKETKVWSCPPAVPIFNENANLGKMMLCALNASGDRVVQIEADSGAEITAAEIRQLTIRAAHNLQAIGIEEGDVVGICTKMSNNIPPLVFACLLLGAPISTMDPDFQIEDFRSIMNQTKPKFIFCESKCVGGITKALNKLNHKATLCTVDCKLSDTDFIDKFFDENGDDMNFISPEIKDPDNYIALIVCSSGTTGISKGIALTHKALINVSETSFKFAKNEVVLSTGSLYWISQCSFLLISTLAGLQRIINSEPFNVEKTLEYVEKYKINLIPMFSSRLASLIRNSKSISRKYDLSSIKILGAYGAMVTETLKSNVNELFPGVPMITAYGATEVIGVATRMIVNYAPESAVGYVTPDCEIKIVDPSGKGVENGTKGEVLLRRSVMFNGYYNDPVSTKEAVDSDGWFHPGDIGYFDDNGCLFIDDRIQDLMHYKGSFCVLPGPLEDKISSIEGIREAVVVGVPHETDVELPAAVVVKSSNSIEVTENVIKKIIAENFNHTNQLRGGVYFVNELPKTPNGKFKRRNAQKLAIEMFNSKQNIKLSKL